MILYNYKRVYGCQNEAAVRMKFLSKIKLLCWKLDLGHNKQVCNIILKRQINTSITERKAKNDLLLKYLEIHFQILTLHKYETVL